jgi:hypothetical protein
MSEKPKTGRVLRDLTQVAQEEKERAKREAERWIWDAELTPEEMEKYKSISDLIEEEAREFQAIKDAFPLGAVRAREPRSIHSPVPKPSWKRKLRP